MSAGRRLWGSWGRLGRLGAQEALKNSQRRPRRTQETPDGRQEPPQTRRREPQEAPRGHHNSIKTSQLKTTKTSKMTIIRMKIYDFSWQKVPTINQILTQNRENRHKITHHIAKSSRRAPKVHARAPKASQKEAYDHLGTIYSPTLAPEAPSGALARAGYT